MGEFFFVIEKALAEEGGTIGGHEKVGSIFLKFFIGRFCATHAHPVGGASASSFFNKKTKTLRGNSSDGEGFDLEGGAIGELDHGSSLKSQGGGVKKGETE